MRLLETTLIRVGNEEYARDNGSFGLTTLRAEHVDVDGAELRFEFRGKSGVRHKVALRDRRLARIIRRCQDLPGQELFQYLDDDGERRTIDSQRRQRLPARDHAARTSRPRTSAPGPAPCSRAGRLARGGAVRRKSRPSANVVRCIAEVAERLGNTKAVCRNATCTRRSSTAYLDGSLLGAIGNSDDTEGAVLKWLRTLY